MLPDYFDYIFVHLRQKVRLRPESSPRFLSTLSPNPARTRPEPNPKSPARLTTLCHHQTPQSPAVGGSALRTPAVIRLIYTSLLNTSPKLDIFSRRLAKSWLHAETGHSF